MATKVLYSRIDADIHAAAKKEAGPLEASLNKFTERALVCYLNENFGYDFPGPGHLP